VKKVGSQDMNAKNILSTRSSAGDKKLNKVTAAYRQELIKLK
jgi:hypothetical protein